MESSRFPQGEWFWLVLVKIPVRSAKELQDRNRVPVRDRLPIAVDTKTVSVGRISERETTISFGGVTRAAVKPDADAIGLAWGRKVPGYRKPIPRSSTATMDGHVAMEIGPHVIIAQAFREEGAARAWAEERHTTPIP